MRLRVALCAAALAAVACGGAPSATPPPWAAAHPDPTGIHFADAQGLCAVTVRYPNEAPGEIDTKGEQFIQRSRTTTAPSMVALSKEIGRSGDWRVVQARGGQIFLVTPDATYEYLTGSHCGSNSAAPT